MSEERKQGCQYVRTWEPLTFCGTEARWRYEAMGGGHMYLCDEHAIRNLNHVEGAHRKAGLMSNDAGGPDRPTDAPTDEGCEVGLPPGKASERRKCREPSVWIDSLTGMRFCDRHARYAHGPRKGQIQERMRHV